MRPLLLQLTSILSHNSCNRDNNCTGRYIVDEAIICEFLQRDLLPASHMLVPGKQIPVTSITQSAAMPVLVAVTQTHAHLISLWTGKPLHR